MTMTTKTEDPQIVLFCYPGSVFARRVTWYLSLRRLPYKQCIQPNRLPRPDLARFGLRYRRIPFLTLNRDIYTDTRLIIRKLDALIPASAAHPSLAPPDAASAGLSALLDAHAIEGGLFFAAVGLMPPDHALVTDAAFVKDREEMAGRRLDDVAATKAARPAAFAAVERVFHLLETTILADGREWVCGGSGPTVADIHATWPLDWLLHDPFMAGALTPYERTHLTTTYPLTTALLTRFRAHLSSPTINAWDAERAAPPSPITGAEAAAAVAGAPWAEPELKVDAAQAEALGVAESAEVEVWPTDYGSAHRDRGRLIGLGVGEVVLAVKGEGDAEFRVHFPREGFAVKAV
ncbi:uncharacterized protein K452DRAFT_360016 [Aplosporella prunicola CBS 121167]|uniref:GST C-terminal domain-containing protein n=1 Tax=Aplosporella prunicola CBS 121167 TaxID=1176127 RepID=A0A6A6B860_9PEZI|nr:uncharacterized protein K452DRAFT_360016 [Aplosporella prunicola CBS 121167]KAF2140402.1 hypothetical protein K452DRAFT_360016 [Aplosporella prunicola CBS 121167]